MKIGTKVVNTRTQETGVVIGKMGRDFVVQYGEKSMEGYLTRWQDLRAAAE